MVGEPLPNLREMSEHDLLILAVQKLNIVCATCPRHEARLDSLELFRAGAMACVGLVVTSGGLLIALGKLVWK